MSTVVTQLITESFYLSSVLSQEFEEISGYELNKGLKLLNSLLKFQTVDDRLIPYYNPYTFISDVGIEKYFIPNLIYAETVTYNIGSVRYPLYLQTRDIYFGSGRPNNVPGLPFQYYIERSKNGCDLYVYFPPQERYEFTLRGKFSLNKVALNEDLELTFDDYYIEYLKYELASYICDDYKITFPPQNMDRLKAYRSKIFDVSPIDFTMRKSSTLQSNSNNSTFDIYAQANIGKGWVPP
jgi:hypothetical protein